MPCDSPLWHSARAHPSSFARTAPGTPARARCGRPSPSRTSSTSSSTPSEHGRPAILRGALAHQACRVLSRVALSSGCQSPTSCAFPDGGESTVASPGGAIVLQGVQLVAGGANQVCDSSAWVGGGGAIRTAGGANRVCDSSDWVRGRQKPHDFKSCGFKSCESLSVISVLPRAVPKTTRFGTTRFQIVYGFWGC